MRITFDPKKRDITLKERGLDFKSAKEVFAGHHFTVQSIQNNYTEQRFMTVGKLDNRMVIVVWVPRGTAYRIMSMRKANEREQKADFGPLIGRRDRTVLRGGTGLGSADEYGFVQLAQTAFT